MKFLRNIFFILSTLFLTQVNIYAELPYYLDFKFILNESEAGKKAQSTLKKNLDNGIKSLNKREKDLQAEEKKIIEQKKIISPEECKKGTELRKSFKSSKDRASLLEKIGQQRKSKNELLKA